MKNIICVLLVTMATTYRDLWSHFSTLEILLFICFKKMYTFPYVALFDLKAMIAELNQGKFQKIFQKLIQQLNT